ncbi:MAG: acetate--CoA ligase family protein [Gammaproteobacteria bacterium]|nr:acetate--CoA ligase family protein [Gammaproteobacteria bacterium]
MPGLPENLRRLLSPRHIAFIGGSDADFSARQCAAQFDGPVWGVNPRRKTLGGVPCYPKVEDLPQVPDAVFLATPRAAATEIVEQLSRIGAGGVACFTAGYGELGKAGQRAEAELVAAAGDMALVGPNCYGLVNYTNGAVLWPFGAGNHRCHRGVALIMQSGMLPANMIMNDRSVPITHVISAGNQALLAIEDYIDVLVDDPAVVAIGLYIEGIRSIKKFADAAIKAITTGKPIVVLKAGKSSLGEQISITHTGSLAGTDQAFQALFDQLGMIRVGSPVEMMETLKFLSISGAPKGNKLAAFTCSGGDAALVADYCDRVGLALVQPSNTAKSALVELLPDIATASNPLDYTTPLWGNTEVMPEVFHTMVGDGYDAAVVIQDFPPAHIHADNSYYRNDAKSFIKACQPLGVPAAVCSDLPENIDRESREIMIAGGVTPLQGLDAGLDAISNACRFGLMRDQVLSDVRTFDFGVIEVPGREDATQVVDEWQGKQRLREWGIEVPTGQIIDIDAVDGIIEDLQYPLVVKAVSAELPHKSESGAVKINLQDAAQLRNAIEEVQNSVSKTVPGIVLEQVMVESMIEDVIAELMIGINTDQQFGQLLVIASGGVLVELISDIKTLLLPTSDTQILNALQGLRCFKLLQGFRGKPAVDIDMLVTSIRALVNFAAAQNRSLVEMDINPLMVTLDRCIAADVMIREVDDPI